MLREEIEDALLDNVGLANYLTVELVGGEKVSGFIRDYNMVTNGEGEDEFTLLIPADHAKARAGVEVEYQSVPLTVDRVMSVQVHPRGQAV